MSVLKGYVKIKANERDIKLADVIKFVRSFKGKEGALLEGFTLESVSGTQERDDLVRLLVNFSVKPEYVGEKVAYWGNNDCHLIYNALAEELESKGYDHQYDTMGTKTNRKGTSITIPIFVKGN